MAVDTVDAVVVIVAVDFTEDFLSIIQMRWKSHLAVIPFFGHQIAKSTHWV